jgi:hypothetical protein
MGGIFMFRNIIFISFLLISTFAFAQDSNTYKNTDMGFEIQKPETWKFEEQSNAPFIFFIKPPLEQEADKLHTFFVLVVASVPGMNSAEGFPAQREMIWKNVLGDAYKKTKEGAVTIANEQGQSLFFQSEMGKKTRWEEYYLVKNSTLYLLQFMAPLDLFDGYRKDFDLIFNSFKLVNASEKMEITPNAPEEDIALDPSSNKIAFICNVDSPSGEYLFLSAISCATKLNNGKPVIIATDGKLSESARHFLMQYSPGKAYLLGSENQGIKGEFIEQPNLLWDSAQTVIVSAKELTTAVMAPPLAVKMKCPLLFDDDKLDSELKRLRPEHIIIVGNVNRDLSGFATKVTILKTALDVAGFFGNFDYVAVTNTYLDENKPERSYLLAPIFAAYHNGVVFILSVKNCVSILAS